MYDDDSYVLCHGLGSDNSRGIKFIRITHARYPSNKMAHTGNFVRLLCHILGFIICEILPARNFPLCEAPILELPRVEQAQGES